MTKLKRLRERWIRFCIVFAYLAVLRIIDGSGKDAVIFFGALSFASLVISEIIIRMIPE